MGGSRVLIRGKNFLGFEIDIEPDNLDEIKKQIASVIPASAHLLKNTVVTLKLNDSNKRFANDIVQFLKEHGVTINAIVVNNRKDLKTDVPVIETAHINLLADKNEKEVATYRGNLRSGQLIRVNGDLVIVGNVNANAYVYATGNIFVLGALHGIPHAGYGGDLSAIIFAFNLNPPQIRIGDLITRAPEDQLKGVSKSPVAEVAYVQDGNIIISPYDEWLKQN